MSFTEQEHSTPSIDETWFESAFDALYPVVYAHRTVEAATTEAAFAIEQLRLGESCSVLDLCCGNGRHMVHLLRHTPHVIGLDYSAALLGFAREHVGPSVSLVRGDMRAIPFVERFDAVANFFTSFGYFQDEGENQAVADGVARALKPGGRFFVDYLNPHHVREHLEPESERESGDLRIVERRWIDNAHGRVNKVTEVFRAGRCINESSESVRLYESAALETLFERAGLRIDAMFGDYTGAPVSPDLPRQILVGERA